MTTKNLLAIAFIGGCLSACAQPASSPTINTQGEEVSSDSIYTYSSPSSADGMGKFYQGRDIAQVMGHQGASWLERSGRQEEEGTDVLINALNLQPDDVVADIGAGSGYFTFRISPRVPQGKVLAVDIQPEMLEMIERKQQDEGGTNVQTILGTVDNPQLPSDSVDWVLLVDAYHEFSHPYEMMRDVADALAPGGRVALVEYREEDPSVMIKPRHKMTEAQAIKEMKAVGLKLIENKDVLPQQHLMIFGKKP
ncbi:MAG: class I SAM-dependent methyltransferase [Tunicatimonas sp.]